MEDKKENIIENRTEAVTKDVMKDTKKKPKINLSVYRDIFVCLLCAAAVYILYFAFTGNRPWDKNVYNSYTLQALSWLEGRLDLGQDYPHLELAVFQGKYFVSFPPFPSYVLFPFALLFGENTPDYWIGLGAMALCIIYAVKLFYCTASTREHAIFWSAFFTLGTNVVYVTALGGQVWFIAQTFALTLSVMALYYAQIGRGGISLACWACSVGCRPMLALYFPVLIYILYQSKKKEFRLRNSPPAAGCWKQHLPIRRSAILADHFLSNGRIFLFNKKWLWVIPTAIIAISYMLLNYFRFGNILEFGHNYLPEFTNSPHGQFDFYYVAENLKNLFRLPVLKEDGMLDWYSFNGFAFWMVSPLFLSYLFYIIWNLLHKRPMDLYLLIAIPVCSILYIFTLLCHKTMGGFHFGNRYLNDVLPFIFYGILCLLPKEQESVKWHYPLFLFGLCLNLLGTIALCNGWI